MQITNIQSKKSLALKSRLISWLVGGCLVAIGIGFGLAPFGVAHAAPATAGTTTLFGTGVSTVSITKGPDGNLWFTTGGTQKIGRITPSGAVSLFFVGVQTADITVGPDGNLWFTTGGAQDIGRITP